MNRRAGLACGMAEGAMQGVLDEAGPALCRGWAWCPQTPELPVELLVLAGGTVLARVVANSYRQDLRVAGIGKGIYGFSVALPDGVSGAISVRRASDGALLGGDTQSRAAA